MSRFPAAPLVAAALALSSLSTGQVEAAAQIEVRHGAVVIADGQTYDFGNTPQGTDGSYTLTVKNLEPAPISVSPIAISTNANDPGHFSVGQTNVVNIPPQGTGSIELIFHADEPGTVTNRVELVVGGFPAALELFAQATTTAPLGPVPRVEHGGSAVPPNSTFAFGSTPLGTDLVRTFTVFNDGDQPLTIAPYGFTFSGNPQNSYTVENANVVDVPPGGGGTFDVRFHADGVESTTWKIRLFVGGTSQYEFWLNATVEPPPQPAMRLEHAGTTVQPGSTLSFGTLGFNDPATKTFTAFNDGDAPLAITNVDWTGDRLNLVQAPPASIPPGGSGTFKLRLKADQAGTHSPQVSIGSNDPASPFSFTLAWTVQDPIGPVLRVQLGANVITQGELVDFGSTGVAIPVTRTFTVFNDGDQPLSVAPIAISSQVGDPASFGVGFNNAVNIPPGGNNSFRLDFDAAGLGSVTSEVDLFVNGTARRTFQLRGTVLPPDFSLTVSPGSRTVEPGQNAFYTVFTQALFGFTGTVQLSLAGLPQGTNHTFTPVDVAAGSSAELKVRTFSTTPPVAGAALTVTGTSGALSHSDTTILNVNEPGDFSLSVSPSLRNIAPGNQTSYTVSLTAIDGFNDSVSLSVSGLPAGASGSFAPATVTPSGSSTLTVTTSSTSPLGDHLLTISASGGGLARSDNATLRLSSSPTGPPEVDGVTPEQFTAGQVVDLTITGQNFLGSTVDVATTPADPGDPLPPVFPTVTLLSVNGSGTSMVVRVDATAPGIGGFYNLAIENAAGATGAPFRVLGLGPEVDIWTPKEPARGNTFSLSMMGVNLNGATVSVSGGGGVSAFVVTTAPNQLTGFLDVASNAPLGPRTLVVRRGGHQTQIPITVVADTAASSLSVINVTAEAAEKAALRGEKVPRILLQEFSVRQGLAWAGTGGEKTKGLCSFTLGWQIFRYNYTLALPFDPLTGRILFDILRNMNLGIPIPTGVRIFSAFADLILEIRFNFCPVSHIQICLIGNIGFEIPGVHGQIFSAGGCFFGGVFFPVFSTTGTVSDFSFRNDGQCTDVVQTTPPTIGNQEAQVTMSSCCTENLRIDTTGSSFDGTIYNFGFSASDFPVVEMSPEETQCACPCAASLGPVDLEPGEGKRLMARLQNPSQASCTYNWSMHKIAGQGDFPLFTPSSGAVTLGPGQERDLGVDIDFPTNPQDGRSPTIELSANAVGDGGNCSARTDVCVIPLDESSAFVQWVAPNLDLAVFQGILSPSIDWTGELVTEGPIGSGTGTSDSCWFPGSAIARYTDANSITSDESVEVNGDLWEFDTIGFEGQFDEYYRAQGRTPCELGTTQHMKRVCPAVSGTRRVEYTTNGFFWDVGNSTLLICRDGTCSTPH